MARNRQRAKQRQAERRRAARLAEERKDAGAAAPPTDGGRERVTRPPEGDGAGRAAEPPAPEPPAPEPPAAQPPPPEPSPAPGVVPPTGVDLSRDVEARDPLLGPAEGQMGELTPEEEELEEERVREDLAEAPDEVDPETLPRTPTEEELGGEVTPRGREAGRHRPRFVNFLVAVWAELRRVQWPKRQALVTLTWVVLVFVVLAGGYLGLLDAIFSRLVQAIL